MLAGAITLAPARWVVGADSKGIAERPNQVRGDEITPAQQASVERGLAWLASQQRPDGSFGDQTGYGAQIAVASLGALAFMSQGNLPSRGKYGNHVSKALDYVLKHTQESGLISAGQMSGEMYSHGFATLFLAEVYGMTGDEEVKEKLQRAIRLIQKCQNPQGGWRYQPAPVDADISVTICQVMALRAARDAGIKVEKEVIDKAIKYVRDCQNIETDGGFSYQAHQGSGSGFARSAAGVAALYYAGVFEGKSLEMGLKYLNAALKPGNQGANEGGHFYYGHYYAVQAMFLAGGKYWEDWYKYIRKLLIERQDAEGKWSGEVSEAYCTAVALIILQMPNRYLPVFNGKGPGS